MQVVSSVASNSGLCDYLDMNNFAVPMLLFLLIPLLFMVKIGREIASTLKSFHADYKRVNNL